MIIIKIIAIYFIFRLVIKKVKFDNKFLTYLVGLIVTSFIGSILISYFDLILRLIVLAAFFYLFWHIIPTMRIRKRIEEWYKEDTTPLDTAELDRFFIDITSDIKKSDTNSEKYKFDINNIPYGRVNAFLNFFEKSIHSEEVYYFSPVKSKNNKEIREYGTCITRNGIFFSFQTDKKSDEDNIINTFVPFSAMLSVSNEKSSEKTKITYANIIKKKYNVIHFPKNISTIDSDTIKDLNLAIINKKIPLTYAQDKVVLRESIDNMLEESEEAFVSKLNEEYIDKTTGITGTIAATEGINQSFNETRNYMNGIRGSGYAAEYGNVAVDRLLHKDVVNEAQNLDPLTGKQIKYGADKVISGNPIQTKYYKTPQETIGSVFEKRQSIYNQDGQMMTIEVPRDQYHKAVELMQKRIDNGQVQGAKPGDNADKYVRKGHFTYTQANNIAISGTIESLTVDVMNGAIVCTQAAGISAIIAFSIAIWNGHSLKDAAQVGLSTGINVLGKGVAIYSISMQLSRDKLFNPFANTIFTGDGVKKSVGTMQNPVFKITEELSQSINNSSFAKTGIGSKIGLDRVSSRAIISGGVTAVIVFGPDICRSLTGRISGMQFVKNSAMGGAGIGGAVLGQTLIPVPILGAVIGGSLIGFVAKKTLDNFIEDDAIFMFQILKEEFLDVVMVSDLTEDEFETVANNTITHRKITKLLMDIYASGDYRRFAREAIVTVAVSNILSNRNEITDDLIVESYQTLLKTTA